MSNAAYIKGRRKEYYIMNCLREDGYDIVIRSAGSHSPVDIIGINTTTKEIVLIQSKAGDITEAHRQRLLNVYEDLNGNYKVGFEVQ